MKEIRLYGELGKRFGKIHRLAVQTTAEAVRALCCTIEGFERALAQDDAAFRVWCGSSRISEPDHLHDPSSDREVIRIAPVIAGSKSALGQIITGIVLIAAAFVTGGASLSVTAAGATLTTTSIFAQAAIFIGSALVASGTARLLSGTPKFEAGSQADRKQSYVFNGPVNTSAQGATVPVGYGRLRVGSVVISASLKTSEVSTF